ncbi:MAG TPA: hypothetical protein VI758_13970 [Bacteroidota bacterium]
MKNQEDEQKTGQPAGNRLRTITAILLLALFVFVAVDGYFNGWGFVRTLVSLNKLELTGKSGETWEIFAQKEFRLVRIRDVRALLNTDSLLSFDRPYRDAGLYRLYFRYSDSSSAKLQKMYQALLNVDTAQTIKHTVEDAEHAYQNLQRILHFNKPAVHDTLAFQIPDSAKAIAKANLDLGSGDETQSVLRKIASSPQIAIGVGIGLAASAGIDLLRGNAYLAVSSNDVFRLDSINLGTRAGSWEGTPIDIVWAFGRQDTVGTTTQVNPPHQQSGDTTTRENK